MPKVSNLGVYAQNETRLQALNPQMNQGCDAILWLGLLGLLNDLALFALFFVFCFLMLDHLNALFSVFNYILF